MSLRFDHSTNNVDAPRRLSIGSLLIVGLVAMAAFSSVQDTAVQPGIDVWLDREFAPLEGRRVGLVTNITGRTADGRSTVDVLASDPRIELAALFSPEHSFFVNREGDIDGDRHATTGLPVHSLYGETRRPTTEMLDGLDALVFDIQDIGTRIYTYATTLAYCMEEAAAAGVPIVVLDRPNPIGGVHVGGPVLDESQISFVGYAPIPVRHGMTIGELALYFNVERAIGADLTVIPVAGWSRDTWFDETGLEWTNPSPNIRNPTQALLYPALGPLEWTDISVGRGTDEPFEWFGAPWMDGARVAAALNAAALPGLRATHKSLTPDASVHADEVSSGVFLTVTNRITFDSGRTLATIAAVLASDYGDAWERSRIVGLWGDESIEAQLDAGLSASEIVSSWQSSLDEFMQTRAQYLLYD